MLDQSTVSVADGHFTVRLWRGGDGPALFYLHGFEGHPRDAPFLEQLAARHTIYAPEHPGFGRSTGVERIDDAVDMALYYRQLAEALDLGAVDLIGHSLGGMFAAEFAAINPQHVRRLVLVSPFGLWLDEAQIPDLFVMSPGQLARATWHDPEAPAAASALARLGNGASGIQAIVGRAMDLSAAGKFLWPIPDRGLSKRLPLIHAPTLVVTGQSDKLIPAAYGDAFVERIPDARLERIADAGHSPMLEQPEAFVEVVEAFLE